jgi:hypothetical protein
VAARADGEVRVAVEDIPAEMRDRALLLRMAGSTEALLRWGGIATASEVDWEPGSSRADIRISWARAG